MPVFTGIDLTKSFTKQKKEFEQTLNIHHPVHFDLI